ncbi:unnamed protein product [Sphagnum troendelagicum]|uniref:Uncharacterized protein n=1 Tax=Sphagnum troendelagicum TaxID=128251 RepID=A0ABP0U9T4_9BRYO
MKETLVWQSKAPSKSLQTQIEPLVAVEASARPSDRIAMERRNEAGWRPIQYTFAVLSFVSAPNTHFFQLLPPCGGGGEEESAAPGSFANNILLEFSWKKMISFGRFGINSKLPHCTSTALRFDPLLFPPQEICSWKDATCNI